MIPSRPRLALRRKVLLALIATIALALSCVGMQTASASTKSRLALSVNPDRSNAVRLNGSTVKGEIYVFVRDSKNLDTVDFYLDGRRRTERVRTETDPPFDLAGTADDGAAVPYDTTKLADGSHRLRVVLTRSDGTRSSRRGYFTVANNGVTATPTASPTTSTTATPSATATPAASPTTSTTATPSATATPRRRPRPRRRHQPPQRRQRRHRRPRKHQRRSPVPRRPRVQQRCRLRAAHQVPQKSRALRQVPRALRRRRRRPQQAQNRQRPLRRDQRVRLPHRGLSL